MSKFQRNYTLNIQGNDGQIHTVQYPFTVEFDVKRDCLAQVKTAKFRIYNLNSQTRQAINKDYFSDWTDIRSITFIAGYQDFQVVTFTGTILSCLSYRDEGRTDFITEIDAYDSGYFTSYVSSTINLPPNSTQNDLIKQLVNDLVTQVANKFKGTYGQPLSIGTIALQKNPTVYSRGIQRAPQQTWAMLIQETQGQCFIDNGKINILNAMDILPSQLIQLDLTSGLLCPPKRYQQSLKVDILFEPRINVGQGIYLLSSDTTIYNGQYKVAGVEHAGIISGAVNGKCKTSCSFIYPFQNAFNSLTQGFN